MLWVTAIVLKPFVALILFVSARLIASQVSRRMPESRLKRLLFLPLHGERRERDAGRLL